jgi:tetratricopeptide (TPR) repeat protein
MPITHYMQRDPRHDHGFTIPDPLLTKELGIPNACDRCHADQTTDWALEYVEQWYGDRMNRHSRARARWIARARQGDDSVVPELLTMLHSEEVTYWRASAASLLGAWLDDPAVVNALSGALRQTDPLVREKAVRSLAPLAEADRPQVREAIGALLADPSRSVRIAAAWALRASVDLDSQAGKELAHMLTLNADQPVGQLQLGIFALARGNLQTAVDHMRKSVEWDPNSAPLRHEYAVVLSMLGRSRDAVAQLEAACRLDAQEAEYRYKLALAWNEVGSLNRTLRFLEEAIRLDPRHHRAWYNLGLARNAQGEPEAAVEALARAESVESNDPRIPYARATILVRLARYEEAKTATRRALELAPQYPAARNLLDSLQ